SLPAFDLTLHTTLLFFLFLSIRPPPPRSTLFPYTTLFRSGINITSIYFSQYIFFWYLHVFKEKFCRMRTSKSHFIFNISDNKSREIFFYNKRCNPFCTFRRVCYSHYCKNMPIYSVCNIVFRTINNVFIAFFLYCCLHIRSIRSSAWFRYSH